MQKEEIKDIRLGDIKTNPLNNYFFDDIPPGDKWEDFKQSVKSGLIERPILSDSLMAVSGHQRVRAMRENNENPDMMVSCVIRYYENEDEMVRDLIETNIQQRGTLSCSPVKMGRIAMALEKINNVRNGGDRKSEEAKTRVRNADSEEEAYKTPAEIASMLNQSRTVYYQNKQLAKLPEEFQEMIERGQITPSLAARVIAKMDAADQDKLLAMLPDDTRRKFTQNEIQAYINKIHELEDHLMVAQNAISGGTEEWLKLSQERDKYRDKARREYEDAQQLKKEVRDNERKMEKLQSDWEIAQARADGTMFGNSPFALIDSATNNYLRALEFVNQSKSCLSDLDEDQAKYITTLFSKAAHLTGEMNRVIRSYGRAAAC